MVNDENFPRLSSGIFFASATCVKLKFEILQEKFCFATNNARHFVLGGFFMQYATYSKKYSTWGAPAPVKIF